MSKSESSSGGVGVIGLLGVLFVGLKLTGVINWSWWWVTAPFWGVFALVVTGFIIYLVVSLIRGWFRDRKRSNIHLLREEEKPKIIKSGFQARLEEALKEKKRRESNWFNS